MNGRFQMQGSKNWILPKEMNANRFFWDSHWLESWSNHFSPSMGPNGGSVAMDSVDCVRVLTYPLRVSESPNAPENQSLRETDYGTIKMQVSPVRLLVLLGPAFPHTE
jgi:hypothetical protein